MSGWIACSTQMPPERKRVLCSTKFNGTVIASFIPQSMGITRSIEAHWSSDAVTSICHSWRFDDVTHWQELPLPVQMPPLPKPKDKHIYREQS